MGDGGLLAYNVNLVRQSLATYIIISICGLIFLMSLMNLVLHLSFSWLRQKSGATILSIIIVEMLLVLCIMFSNIFFQDFNPIFYHYPGSQNERQGCETLAGFNIYFFFVSRMYSACISHELQLVIQNPTYSSKQWHVCYHFTSNMVSLVFLIILATTGNIGMSSTLLCWNKYKPESLTNKQGCLSSSIVITVFLVALIVFTIFNLYFLFRKAPKVLKKEFRGYMIRYSAYLMAEIVVDLINVFQMFFACLNNRYFSRGIQYSLLKHDGYNGLRYFSGAINLFIPFFLTVLRLTDPQVRRIMKESICKRKGKQSVNALQRLPTDHSASFIELQTKENKGGTFLSKQSSTVGSLSRTQTSVSSQDHGVKEQSVYISINTILTGICYSLQQAESEGLNQEMMNLEEEICPHPKFFKQKFTSILNRKKSLREVYRNDVMSTQNRNYDIKIKQYAPGIFQTLRLMDEIEPAQLVTALSPGNNEQNLQNFMAGAGKSNAFFFFTQDLHYAIKTINREEFNTLIHRLLPKYYSHILEHPDSILARILGVFSVRASHMNKIYIMIMRNLLGKDKPYIKRIYDLKGSTYKRSALERTNSQLKANTTHNSRPPPTKVLKDLDLLKFQDWICLSEKIKKKLICSLTLDSQMLRSCNLMDYSLLVARFEIPTRTQEKAKEQEARILREQEMRQTKRYKTVTYLKSIAKNEQLNVRVQSPEHSLKAPLSSFFEFNMADNIVQAEKEKIDPHRFPSTRNPKIVYSISVIDFLQNYNFRKQMEYQGRKLAHPRVSPDTLSVQNPHAYGDRFVRFMERVVKTPSEVASLPLESDEPKSAGHRTVN